jgi:hypothetical protein
VLNKGRQVIGLQTDWPVYVPQQANPKKELHRESEAVCHLFPYEIRVFMGICKRIEHGKVDEVFTRSNAGLMRTRPQLAEFTLSDKQPKGERVAHDQIALELWQV